MKKRDFKKEGLNEIREARKQNRLMFWLIALFSFFVNLLMLTSPFYMLQVYDRVLSSRSIETLIALSILVAFLYLMMGVLDFVRGRILARIGLNFYETLAPRVFTAMQNKSAAGFAEPQTKIALRDLESMQKLLSSPITAAMFDMPWVPAFFVVIALFHPLLGLLAVLGGLLLVVLALLNQWTSNSRVDLANMMTSSAHLAADNLQNNAEIVQALGMNQTAFAKWKTIRSMATDAELGASDIVGSFGASTKAIRMALQSAMLGFGAYLVLTAGLTPGVMIAGSIILGRALAPIETVIGQWAVFQRAMQGRERVAILLGEAPNQTPPMNLGRPEANVKVTGLSIVPPSPPPNTNKPTLQGVSFALGPGQAMGVIGMSGSGKSSLARALTGVWHPVGGKIELGNASINQYDKDQLGRYIGYLPQQVTLFDGTISENIARLDSAPNPEEIILAAKKAAVHDMILQLPKGYDTQVKTALSSLSGGQLQRIGLARAFYGNPLLLVLDEPNSNLDNNGNLALNQAISSAKAAGCAVIIMAHRPAAIQLCEFILVLEAGRQVAFGPRDETLRQTTNNPEATIAAAKAAETHANGQKHETPQSPQKEPPVQANTITDNAAGQKHE